MKICILYDKYYDYLGDKLTIGGIQTYITNLTGVLLDLVMKFVFFKEQKRTLVSMLMDTE